MFRVLSDEESQLVKKWRAPNLADSISGTNEFEQEPEQSAVTDDGVITDIVELQSVARKKSATEEVSIEEASVDQKENNVTSIGHTNLSMISPSAEVLQQTYDEGYSAGVNSMGSQADSHSTDMVTDLLDGLSVQKFQLDGKLEQEILSLSKAIAKVLLRKEVASDDASMLGIVRQALAEMPIMAEPISVKLHPTDLAAIEALSEISADVKLVPDSQMKRGGCIVESGASLLDAGIDALVASISSRIAHSSPSQVTEVELAENQDAYSQGMPTDSIPTEEKP